MNEKKSVSASPNDIDAQNGFEYRPFLQIAELKCAKPKPSAKKKESQVCSENPEEDKKLFLAAIEILAQKKKQKAAKGFLLADQCPLPEMKKPEPEKKVTHRKEICKKPDPDYANEFLLAMRNATPLGGKGRKIAPKPEQTPQAQVSEANFADMLNSRLEFSLMYSDEYLEGRVRDLDDLLMNRLREGQMSPEAHLDLHGLNASQAFEELKIFIRNSWYKGLRVVLVITGRGLNSPLGQGVLRRKVQEWLSQEPFKRVVLAFCTACPKDGGPGSMYILLRRFRKKGHISWDKLPADADLYPC